jgi:hypothetical protein
MVRIIPSRLKSYGGNTPGGSRSSSPAPPMHRRDHSPGLPGPKANGLMLRIVVLRVRALDVRGATRNQVLMFGYTGQKSCREG